MNSVSSRLDESIVDEVKRYSIVDLVELLFPGRNPHLRGAMSSPFREDRHPSLSLFRGYEGYYFWKDHSTDETGDNITLYRKVFPELDYEDAVDALAHLVLGKSAKKESSQVTAVRRSVREADETVMPLQRERESRLKLISDRPLFDPSVPPELKAYWRSRGISDETIVGMNCRYIVFENLNRKGMDMLDPVSGLPVLDDRGEIMKYDGVNHAIGMYNDIGGFVYRLPDDSDCTWKKGCSNSFITTILSDGSRPAYTTGYVGLGSNRVEEPLYEESLEFLRINRTQGFSGVRPWSAVAVMPMVRTYRGVTLGEREVKCICAVLNSLNVPRLSSLAIVEGTFDGLSEREMNRSRILSGRGRDLVIANSVTNLRWAVPFICRHTEVHVLLDNDLSSGAGQKACEKLRRDVAEYNSLLGGRTLLIDDSGLFAGYKDLNEGLMARKGFPIRKRGNGQGL